MYFTRCIIVSMFMWIYCDAYRILCFFSIPAKSHSILGEGYVRHLLDAGHDVTYITPILMKIQHPRLRQIDISENSIWYPSEVFNVQSIMNKEYDMLDYSAAMVFQYFFTSRTLLTKPVQDLLMDTKESYDLVVVEWMYNELGSGLAAVFDCPLIWSSSMAPHTLVLSLIDQHLNPAYTFHLHSPDRSFTFAERISQLWKIIGIEYYIWSQQSDYEEIFRSIYEPALSKRGRELPPYNKARYNASMVLGNGNIIASDNFALPKNYKDIGGYHIIDALKPLPQNLEEILDKAANGVIYFSLGSVLKTSSMSEELQMSLLDILKDTNRTVIWNSDVVLPNLPKNVHMINWTPQINILAHPNCVLFMTHAGLLSITEAIYSGVPIIGFPLFADQFTNINKAVDNGFGRKSFLHVNSVGDLKELVTEVLENPSYRQRAKELSEIYHHRLVSPGKELVFWIEHVIRSRGALHLKPNSTKVEWYKKTFLDLFAAILLVFIIIFIMFKYVFRIQKRVVVKINKTN